MKTTTRILLCATLLVACNNENPTSEIINPNKDISIMPYPDTKKTETIDTYFGTQVTDPYRWLEDDMAEDTKAWVIQENEVTKNYLSQILYRNAIKNRLENLWNYEKFTATYKEGDFTYLSKNDGLRNQYLLNRQKNRKRIVKGKSFAIGIDSG